MFFPPALGPDFARVVKPFWDSNEPDHVRMKLVWSLLTALQGVVLGQILVKRIGDKVFAGPFRGMTLIPDVMDKPFTPALLGTYEWELHDAIEKAIAQNYKQIVNVGCSYGYYAVGFARRMPEAKIFAFDSDETARNQCRKMAEENGVADRVIIGERFSLEDFSRFADEETLLFMDADGEEEKLLDPQNAPNLKKMDVIAELHDCLKPGLSANIPMRFAATHSVRVMPNAPFSFPLEKILGPDYVPDHFDNLIATWEGRSGPSPFGIFIRK